MDKHGFLYVSDAGKNEVRRWKMGEYNNEGIVVAGGHGEGDQLNQLDSSSFIFVDEDQSVYISDNNNNRVIVDHLGQIYVADCGNDRLIRWYERKEEGGIVVGGNGHGNQSDQLNCPMGLSFDAEGNLYVTDSWNHRVERFEIIL
ncbi:unnamed protein product [Adineta steineri]|uniref:Uncharacterized protein n=1 Tax=Adineta steineri TaxID=433720 RepID=A0A815L7P6_9BILA|nr:unnamed protein product [Adineta steineri]CAF1399763.1 unnamed protein product [Adineta steineri]